MCSQPEVKAIAKIVNHSKDINYEIFNNFVDFVKVSSKNGVNSEESITIVPLDDVENGENQIVCSLQKENDDTEIVKPFVFRSFCDDFFMINNKPLRKGQRIILQNLDKISLFKNSNTFYIFHDLRQLIKTKFPSSILKEYFVEKLLSDSSNGMVYLVHNIRTLDRLAVKRVEKLKNEPKNDFAFEAKIMKLNHPNIVRLVYADNRPKFTFLFTEFLNCQDMLHLINSTKNCRFCENDAKDYFYQIAQGLKFLHQSNICHRDIKCDNIFVHRENNGKIICKIGDFGLCAYDKDLHQPCGTIQYAPPELLCKNRFYKGTKCDIWSFGVVLFCMISGKFPFHKIFTEYGTVEQQIKKGIVRFRCDAIWNNISYECKHLICCMINVDPICRYSIFEVLEHPWLENRVAIQNNRKRQFDVTLTKNVNSAEDFVPKQRKISIKA